MKKNDFKKLALLGMAAGALVATSAEAHEVNVSAETTLAAKCGSGGKCGGSNRPANNQIAEEDEQVIPNPNGCQGAPKPVVPPTNGQPNYSGCSSPVKR